MRGRKVPSFYSSMLKNKVDQLLKNALEERQDLFVINMTMGADNAIKVIIDGDNGVLVGDCMFISRAIEHNLDREEEDFSLEVLSAGAASPLTMPRQYKKNIGRMVQVKPLEKGKFEGRLSLVDEKGITIICSEKKRIEGRKKKEVVEEEFRFDFDKIKETKIVVSFK